jgi:hypothetical protein
MDTVLLSLMGAFDATARVTHRALNVPGSERNAGWQRGWVKQIGALAPDLAQTFARATVSADVLRALSILRNSLHGAGLQTVAVERAGSGGRETQLILPSGDATELMEIVDRRSWAARWGIESFRPNHIYAQPDLITEHLLSQSIPLLDRIMELTPVESLLAPDEVVTSVRLTEDFLDPFASRNQSGIRRQLGIPAV